MTALYTWNYYNIVNQLYFNKKQKNSSKNMDKKLNRYFKEHTDEKYKETS